MLERICVFLHNYFTESDDVHEGNYTITGGSIALPFLVTGQYFRIVGSRLNDGVYQYPASGLEDEAFDGEIWAMKVPKMVRDIAFDAAALEAKNADALNSPYTSESVIGAYSYTKASSAGNGADDWLFGKNGVYGARLNQWRRLA